MKRDLLHGVAGDRQFLVIVLFRAFIRSVIPVALIVPFIVIWWLLP